MSVGKLVSNQTFTWYMPTIVGFPYKVASAEAYPGDPTIDVLCICSPIIFDFFDDWEGSRLKVRVVSM
jgi:hypothetical protein